MMLLVGKPGYLREALQTMIESMLGLETILTADAGLLALRTVRELEPALVVVGGGLPDAEVGELVRQIKAQRPATRCLVLTNGLHQPPAVLAAGADRVLPPGLPLGQVMSAVQEVMEETE